MTGPTIDVHCHYMPAALIERIRVDGPAHSIELLEGDGDARVSFAQRDVSQPFPKGMLDLEERLTWMDERKIDVQVLSPWMDFSAYVLDPEDGAWVARCLNELTAEAVATRPTVIGRWPRFHCRSRRLPWTSSSMRSTTSA